MSLRPERLSILAELRNGGGLADEIAQRVSISAALVGPVLDLLVMQGLVERKDRDAHPAAPLYQITVEGILLLDSP